jgi:hypothetical protein
VDVLLCTVVAMGLTVDYLPRGTFYRQYLVFASTAATVFPDAGAATVVAGVTEARALRESALTGRGPLLLTTTLLRLLFLV